MSSMRPQQPRQRGQTSVAASAKAPQLSRPGRQWRGTGSGFSVWFSLVLSCFRCVFFFFLFSLSSILARGTMARHWFWELLVSSLEVFLWFSLVLSCFLFLLSLSSSLARVKFHNGAVFGLLPLYTIFLFFFVVFSCFFFGYLWY